MSYIENNHQNTFLTLEKEMSENFATAKRSRPRKRLSSGAKSYEKVYSANAKVTLQNN
jgi:hypothetical protein